MPFLICPFSLDPNSLKHRTFIVHHSAPAMHLVLGPGALKIITAYILKLAVPMSHIFQPLPLIDIAIRIAHLSLAMTFAFLP